MTENCEDIQLCYYAAKLAQYSKLGDGNAFSALHDAIGKSNLKSSLPKIEDLAQEYSGLSLCLLECKLKKLRSSSTIELGTLCGELASNGADMTAISFPSSFLEFPSNTEATTKESMITAGGHPASESLISDFVKADEMAECSGSTDVLGGKDCEICLENPSECHAESKTDEIIDAKDGKDQGRSSSNKSKKKKKKKSKKKSKKDPEIQEKLSPTDSNISNEAVSNDISEESTKIKSENHEYYEKENTTVDIPPSKEKTELKPKNGIVSTPFGPIKDISQKLGGGAESLSQKNATAKDNHSSVTNPDALQSLQPEISFIIDNLDCFTINKSVPIQTDTVSNNSVEFYIDTVTSERVKLTFDTMPEHAIALPLDNVPDSSVTFPFDTVNDCVPTHKNYVPESVPEVPENKPNQISQGTNDSGASFNDFVGKLASDINNDIPGFQSGKLPSRQTMPKPPNNKSGKPPFDHHAAVEFLWNEWIQVTK